MSYSFFFNRTARSGYTSPLAVLLLLFPLLPLSTEGQTVKKKVPATLVMVTPHRCGTYEVMEKLYRTIPGLRNAVLQNRQHFRQFYETTLRETPNRSLRTSATLQIPVVVHIVLPDPDVITDAQVATQLEVLNADFAGLNADSTRIPAAFKPFYGKSKIRFCLAQRDPLGDPTNGIQRIRSNLTSSPGLNDPVKYSSLGGADAWDAERYLNIWVCQTGGGLIGYAFTPEIPLSTVPLHERGFVVTPRAFGTIGTAQAPFNLGRTGTHEIGHFFNLEHTWGPNNCNGTQTCTDDDGVNDTPTQQGCTYGAPRADSVITDDCQPTAPGIMWMNFMNYVDDAAMVMFTHGQAERMETAIVYYEWLNSLANSDACTPPVPLQRDIRFERFVSPTFQVCNSSINPVVRVKNNGTENITRLSFSAKLGNSNAVITQWTGNLAPLATADITLAPMNVTPGLNPNLEVFCFNPNNAPDQKPSNDTGKLASVLFPLGNNPIKEGFENVGFPPTNWQRFNPDNYYTWERTTTGSKTGLASMYINNYDNDNNGASDWMFAPLIPVKDVDSVFVTFQVAAATYSDPNDTGIAFDTLQVLVSTDCGQTYRVAYSKGGKNLITTSATGFTDPFYPTASQWRKDSVYLSPFIPSDATYAQVVFRNITQYENNIFIDDVNLYTVNVNPNLKAKGVMVTPNPFSNVVTVQHYPNPTNIEFIQVFNSSGQLVWEKRIAWGNPANVTGPAYQEIDLSGHMSGLYTVKIVYRNKRNAIFKVMKINN